MSTRDERVSSPLVAPAAARPPGPRSTEPAASAVDAKAGTAGAAAHGRARGGLRLRLTLLFTALLALVGALLLSLTYFLVGVIVDYATRQYSSQMVIGGSVITSRQIVDQGVSTGHFIVLIVGGIAYLLFLIAGTAVAWILVGRALGPLATLTSATRGLSSSSLDRRIRLQGPRDEVAELADNFDDMLDRLQSAFEAERRFVANASHELRTPLSVIRTEVDVTLADRNASTEDYRQMGDVVREATDRADRLLSSLLFLARTQANGIPERRPVDLAELVEPAVRAVEAERAAREVRVRIDAQPAPVVGDRALLERVVGNLVENAVRHNVLGGPLEVSTGLDESAGFVQVRSGGPVIEPATVALLFEPFRQGERARTGHRGSGLGLSIVRSVVAAHGGSITAAPVPGGGLSVRVEIPTESAPGSPT